jgi:hypothetical protein
MPRDGVPRGINSGNSEGAMAYRRPENLGSHGERRVIGILTLTNIVGGFAGLAGLWLLAGLLDIGGDQAFTAGWFMRLLLAAAGGTAGVVATFRWTGISLWDKVVLWGGYQIRRSMGQTLLKPPAAARATGQRVIAPIMRGGQIIAEVYDPNEERALALEGSDRE